MRILTPVVLLRAIVCAFAILADAADADSCKSAIQRAGTLGATIVADQDNGLIWALCIPNHDFHLCGNRLNQKMFYDQIKAYEGHVATQQWRLPTSDEITKSTTESPKIRRRIWQRKGFYWVQPPVAGNHGYAWYAYEPSNRIAEFGNLQFAAFLRLVMPCT